MEMILTKPLILQRRHYYGLLEINILIILIGVIIVYSSIARKLTSKGKELDSNVSIKELLELELISILMNK